LQHDDADIGNAYMDAFSGDQRCGWENAQEVAAGQRHRMPHYRTRSRECYQAASVAEP
jgi:hypothetical protein